MKQMTGVVTAVAVGASCMLTCSAQTLPGSRQVNDAKIQAVDLPPLPQVPSGKSTILGGSIQQIDPVLDQLTLHVFGQKPMKILYDERTQLFLDGKRIPLRDLRPAKYASIQTTLDGASVFAISIRLLSQSAPAEYQGQVLSYNPSTGELTVGDSAGRVPLTVMVYSNTSFTRKGQDAFSSAQSGPADLQRGSLVSIAFDSDSRHRAVASQITVLATPGSDFVFAGNLTAIDTASGMITLVDPRDDHSYQVRFNSSTLPIAQSLQIGQHVRVAVEYDGAHYQARDITIY